MIATITHLTGRRRGERQTFDDEIITIGRAADNQLCFGDAERRVSSHHAQISRHGDAFLIRDLGSTNGTMINGRRIIISEIAADDLIEFGAGGACLLPDLRERLHNATLSIATRSLASLASLARPLTPSTRQSE